MYLYIVAGMKMLGILALLAVGGGCSHTTTGLPMTGDRIAFIRNGVTTRAEVVATLGVPLHEFESECTIAYTWEREGPGWGYSFWGSYHELSRKDDHWFFCVRFDQSDRVNRHGKTRQLETESSSEAVLRWLKQ